VRILVIAVIMKVEHCSEFNTEWFEELLALAPVLREH